ncbi:prolyl oligopeptidase family serine peptidase, partial [bacterium]|nr:prolyl oligopeptidase family serine peptidase [bacterium]
SVRGRCPLAPRLLERQVGPTCVRDKIAIQTEPGMWVPSYVVYPRRAPRKMPAVILFHGSGPGKEAYAPDEAAGPFWASSDVHLGGMPYGLARALRCLVYVPDQRSQGEWGEWFSGAGARRAGYDTLAMRMWDHTRSLDYLCARGDVDAKRIGCLGSSGGGMATMYTAGIDERISAAILSSMPPYLVKVPGQFFDDMWSDGDLGDAWAPLATTPSITPNVCALTIPRPLWIMDGKTDSGLWEGDAQGALTNALDRWQAARDEIARLYQLAGVPDRFRQSWFDGGHCAGMTVPNAVEWFRRWW